MRLFLFLLAWLPLSAAAAWYGLDPLVRLLGFGREDHAGILFVLAMVLVVWAVVSGFAWELVRRHGAARKERCAK